MNTARSRRAAYAWVAHALQQAIRNAGEPAAPGVASEVERILRAFCEAAAVEDEIGVDEALANPLMSRDAQGKWSVQCFTCEAWLGPFATSDAMEEVYAAHLDSHALRREALAK
jgi:hypothetical protein